MLCSKVFSNKSINYFTPGSLADQARYKNTGTEIAVNLGFAYGHFDKLCLIKTNERPTTKGC